MAARGGIVLPDSGATIFPPKGGENNDKRHRIGIISIAMLLVAFDALVLKIIEVARSK